MMIRAVLFDQRTKRYQTAQKHCGTYVVQRTDEPEHFLIGTEGARQQYDCHLQPTKNVPDMVKVGCSCPDWTGYGYGAKQPCKHLHMIYWGVLKLQEPFRHKLTVLETAAVEEPEIPEEERQLSDAEVAEITRNAAQALRGAAKNPAMAGRDAPHAASMLSAEGIHRDLSEHDEETALAVVPEATSTLPAIPDIDAVAAFFDAFQKLKKAIIKTEDTAEDKGVIYYKKTAYQKLARVFNVSSEIFEEDELVSESGKRGFKCTMIARLPNGCCAMRSAVCYHGEPKQPANLPDHFIRAKAETRAFKRAVDALLAGGMPPAEED